MIAVVDQIPPVDKFSFISSIYQGVAGIVEVIALLLLACFQLRENMKAQCGYINVLLETAKKIR